MIRIAKKSDPVKLLALKAKINDEAYINLAIQRLAQTLTKELLEKNEKTATR